MLAVMQPRQDPERMRSVLAKRDRHGWSLAELSRRSGLPVWKLRWWQRRLARKRPARRSKGAFLPVQVVESPPVSCSRLEVITPSGVRIVVSAGFDTEHLKRVIKAVESGC